MKTAVIVNNDGGSSVASDNDITVASIRAAFEQRQAQCTVFAVTGGELIATAQKVLAERFDLIVAGGGDGTISAVASVVAGSGIPLGVLPLGTLNHFARDLGIPATLEDAADVALHGVPTAVDVAEVNGHVFINNSSLGLYPHMVRRRDGFIDRLGIGKWSAMLRACLNMLGQFPLYRVTIGTAGTTATTTTPLVFIGNNRYTVNLLELGRRERIDRGELNLYCARCSGWFCLFRFALRAVLGTLDQSRNFESALVQQVQISTSRRRLHVALDGEVMTIETPLLYRIRPQALTVMVPQLPEEA